MPTKFIKCGFEDRVIQKDGFYPIILNGKKVGFNLDLRINYYRGLPLSSVQEITVKLDGTKIPDKDILVELNGKIHEIRQLKDLSAEYWGIKTPMHLRIYGYDLEDVEHDIEVTVIHRSPYMAFAPGEYGMIDGSASKRMRLGEGRDI